MSAIDWLRILDGFRYCLRWSIAILASDFAYKAARRPRKHACSSQPRLTEES